MIKIAAMAITPTKLNATYCWTRPVNVRRSIPPDASVAATKRTANHVALRRYVWYFPHRLENADFLLTWDVDLRDKREGKKNKKKLKQLLGDQRYTLVTEKHGLHLYKRNDNPKPKRRASRPTPAKRAPVTADRPVKATKAKALGPVRQPAAKAPSPAATEGAKPATKAPGP